MCGVAHLGCGIYGEKGPLMHKSSFQIQSSRIAITDLFCYKFFFPLNWSKENFLDCPLPVAPYKIDSLGSIWMSLRCSYVLYSLFNRYISSHTLSIFLYFLSYISSEGGRSVCSLQRISIHDANLTSQTRVQAFLEQRQTQSGCFHASTHEETFIFVALRFTFTVGVKKRRGGTLIRAWESGSETGLWK